MFPENVFNIIIYFFDTYKKSVPFDVEWLDGGE
jgi:hypothetical protein